MWKADSCSQIKVFLVQTSIKEQKLGLTKLNVLAYKPEGKMVQLSSNCPHGGTLIPRTKTIVKPHLPSQPLQYNGYNL